MSKTTTYRLLKIFSFGGIGLSALPAFLVLAGVLTKETYLWCMVIGMTLWFGTAIFWINPEHK